MVAPVEKPESQDVAAQNAGLRWKGPARYRIVVGKQLSPNWSDRLAGMDIKPREGDPSQATVTMLEGMIQDQAQLLGVLNTLNDLGFPILKVDAVEEESARDS